MDSPSFDTLLQTRLFENLELAPFADLLAQCRLLACSPGDVLLEPGEPNDNLYVLLDGELKVCVARSDTEALSIVRRGDCVGEVSWVDQRPPSAFVVASQASQVLRVPAPVLLQMVKRNHLIGMNLMRIQAEHFRLNLEHLKSSQFSGQRYRELAETDALTGLYNRAWCNLALGQRLADGVAQGVPVSLAMLDIDHFKSVNDRYGHPAGDEVLRSVASLLRRRFRSTDGLARFGGEEFLVLMPGTALEQAQEVLDGIRQELAAWPIALPDGQALQCTVSMGVAEHAPNQSLEELISLADQMLYRAKRGGRNQVMSRLKA